MVMAAAGTTVASLWLNGVYTPQVKAAKAFANLYLGLQHFFPRKLPQCTVSLNTRNHQTPGGLHPLRREAITESRETVKHGHKNGIASDVHTCEHLSAL